MTGAGFARVAIALGIVALVLRLAPHVAADGAPGALAWPLVAAGTGLWIAALVELRRNGTANKVNRAVLWAGAAMLALGAINFW